MLEKIVIALVLNVNWEGEAVAIHLKADWIASLTLAKTIEGKWIASVAALPRNDTLPSSRGEAVAIHLEEALLLFL